MGRIVCPSHGRSPFVQLSADLSALAQSGQECPPMVAVLFVDQEGVVFHTYLSTEAASAAGIPPEGLEVSFFDHAAEDVNAKLQGCRGLCEECFRIWSQGTD